MGKIGILTSIIVLFIVAAVYAFSNKTQKLSEKPPAPRPFHKLNYSGSIGNGNKVEPGIASLKQNASKLNYLSLYWYELDSGGNVSRRDEIESNTENDVLSFAHQNNIKVLMGIESEKDNDALDEILDHEDEREKHISSIVKILQERNYDGIIVDYEYLQQFQAEEFTAYIQNLSRAIKNEGKITFISVNVETRGRIFHGIDIVEISKVVDRIHLNVYEQHGEDTPPGPIASIDWVNAIIKNAINQGVAPNKIVLGTAHSGHDWITDSKTEFYKDMSTKEALEIQTKTKAKRIWDQKQQAYFFEYKDDEGKTHIVWLEDALSFAEKINLAKSYELQGIFLWYLGGEDTQIWQAL